MNIEKILNIMWDTMVWVSGFVLFTQLIINSLYGFKFYWLINWFILVALYQILSIKFSRADIMKAFSNSSSDKSESFNKDLTATQQVASPKSATQTSLNPDINRNPALPTSYNME